MKPHSFFRHGVMLFVLTLAAGCTSSLFVSPDNEKVLADVDPLDGQMGGKLQLVKDLTSNWGTNSL